MTSGQGFSICPIGSQTIKPKTENVRSFVGDERPGKKTPKTTKNKKKKRER